MPKKRVLLVGVSSGIGLMAADLILKHDFIVYAAAPDIELMKSLADKGAHLLEMDVTSTSSVQAAVNKMISEQGGIDCVHFNAGINVSGPVEAVTEELSEQIFQVNVMGAARVIRAVTPQLRKQRSGRMIFTGSVISHISMRMMGWYSSTKHALYALITAYRQEVKDFGIEVVIVEPGQINTGFDQVAMAKLQEMAYPSDYDMHVKQYLSFNTELLSKSPNADSSAKAIEKAIIDKKPKLIYKTTFDAHYVPWLNRILGPKIVDKIIIDKLKSHAR